MGASLCILAPGSVNIRAARYMTNDEPRVQRRKRSLWASATTHCKSWYLRPEDAGETGQLKHLGYRFLGAGRGNLFSSTMLLFNERKPREIWQIVTKLCLTPHLLAASSPTSFSWPGIQ